MAMWPREHLELASEPSPRLKSGVKSYPERLPSRGPAFANVARGAPGRSRTFAGARNPDPRVPL